MLDHLNQIGFVFSQFREKMKLTQQQLATECGAKVSRTAIALLEQGRRLPSPEVFKIVAEKLGIPESIWAHFAKKESRQRHEFEAALGELIGHTITLKMLHIEHIAAAEKGVEELFTGDLTLSQACDALNSLLVYYGLPRMERKFFDRYFSAGAFQSVDAFEKAIRNYQKEAIRLFSTFGEAYRRLNGDESDESMEALLAPLTANDIAGYSERTVWEHTGDESHKDLIAKIDESRLPYLGYISVARYRGQRQKRQVLAGYLRELATAVRERGGLAVDELTDVRQLRIASLMRELDSSLQHTPISPLFAPNPAELDAEAARILRDEADIEEMAGTQSQALTNLSNYVSADYMDVYVATSMRTESDFVCVNRFVSHLFAHEEIAPLRLRYFNPTQSWIEDRVAKGLVEALMLRRAHYTIYMAQKGDTFGKDSEASVALGQGKPVIVYVPKVSLLEADLDSETLMGLADSKLRDLIQLRGDIAVEDFNELDHDGLFSEALFRELNRLDSRHLVRIVRENWADFGLLDESERIRGEAEATRREAYSTFIKGVIERDPEDREIPPRVRADMLPIFTALCTNFEKRARTFREVHPLALQVILSTGVLNGILVTRSVDSSARILRALIENRLDLELSVEADNYRLIEKSTRSTIRVMSRNNLLVNAFETYYGRSKS